MIFLLKPFFFNRLLIFLCYTKLTREENNLNKHERTRKMMTRHKKLIVAIAIVLSSATVAGAGIGLIAVENGNSVGEQSAKEIALAHAGLAEAEVTIQKIKLDRDDGRREYEVEFRKDGVKYEYEIDAESGEIISFDKDVKLPSTTDANGTAIEGSITADQAKTIALAHAGLAETDVTYTKVKLDRDDGRDQYEIDFVKDNLKYEYEIDALSGEIISYDKETKKNAAAVQPTVDAGSVSEAPAVNEQNTAPVENESNKITDAAAKAITLDHAGLTEADVTFTKVKLDRDDGRIEYEIEFRQGDIEYEYEIDAQNGNIIDFEREYDD